MTTVAKCIAFFVVLGLGAAASAEVQLRGSGATFPDPIYQAWFGEYQKSHPDVKIDYQPTGSGPGIKAITDKTSDFAGSDAPMNKDEIAKAGGPENIVEIPTVAGAVVLAYNIPDFTGELKLDGQAIGDIYLGTIKNWNDAKIAALNPGVKLPALPITPIYRSDGSGTNYIFTSYVSGQNVEFQSKIGAAKSVKWPTGTGGEKSAGVAQLLKGTKGGIGYLEIAYALKNNIPVASMKNKGGNFIKPTTESVSLAGEAAADKLKGQRLIANIWDQAGDKVYPISSFTYIIVYKELNYTKDPAKAKALADFLRWATTDGQKIAPQLNYAPLSPGVQKKATEALGMLTLEGQPVK